LQKGYPFKFIIRGTGVVTYGYRSMEVGLELKDEETPDDSYNLKRIFSNAFYDNERKPMRISLGPHVNNAALPVPDLYHAPSQVTGAVKRVAAKMPELNRRKYRKFQRFVKRFLRKNFTQYIMPVDEDLSFETWINNSPYPLYRREELTRAYYKSQYSKIKFNVDAFIKDENYPEFKHFRGIYSRCDDYKVRVGPFFKAFGDRLFSTKWFIKKIPVNDRAKFIKDRFGNSTKLFCTDFSSFEAMFTEKLLNVEMEVYKFILGDHPMKKQIIDDIHNGIMAENRINFNTWRFGVDCKRMSGEMNTSCGNGVMNMLITFFLLEEAGNKDYDGVFEGDDGIVRYDYKAPTSQDYRELGAKIKIEIPNGLNEASFCGNIFDLDDLDNVVNPLEALVSFGWTNQQYMYAGEKTKMELLKAKSLSLLYQYSGCPILRSLALYGLRVTNKIKIEDVVKRKIK
jgi:hypothetical protein